MAFLSTRRQFVATAVAASITLASGFSQAAEPIKLRLSAVNSATDMRAVSLIEKFAPAVKGFANFEPHWNGALFKQGTELEAISRGNLEMSIASAQELSVFFPEFSIFTAGYLHRDAEHQKKVFNADLFKPFKQKVEDKLGVKLLTVMYLGRRQLNLRTEKTINKPEDLAGVKLRMPGSDSWLFLGRALGANPTPMAFTEVYTGLQTGAIDGQDNPLPTTKDKKFYEVTKQIVLTSHLVDLNYLTISKKVWNKLTPEQQKTVQKAADDAAEFGRQAQLKQEAEMVDFMKAQGLKVYTPDLNAFRSRVQEAYLKSDFSKEWPKGLVEKINAL
jgi:tripartite ATP-independent transporter DctP family solute receptor